MTSIRNNLLVLLILSIFVKVSVATEAVSSSQVKNEQIESCVTSNDYSLGKSFLDGLGIKTDSFGSAPEDVKCFVDDAAMCEHFAGEEPYDNERKKEIIEGLMKYCTSAQNRMRVLKRKYNDLPDVRKILAVCESKDSLNYEPICATFDPAHIIH